MTDLIIYLLKVVIIQAICLGFYRLVLSRTAHHQLNRFFIIGTLLFSLVIPLVHVPISPQQTIVVEEDLSQWVASASSDYIPETTFSTSSASASYSWISIVYFAIVLLLLARSAAYLIGIYRIQSLAQLVESKWFKLFKTHQPKAFSFFRSVFIPEEVFHSKAYHQILAHECVHVRQRHSIDRLLMDFLVSLFWFNPFMYWYRNALIEIHEFQADQSVIRQFQDPVGYQEILYHQLATPHYSGLVSHFNFSTIKKRIVMINNQQQKKQNWVFALVVPLLLAVTFAFSHKKSEETMEKFSGEIAHMLGPELHKSTLGFRWQEDRTPNLFPITGEKDQRITSKFGMRRHPINKEMMQHKGIDIGVQTGTDVVATAAGEVMAVAKDKEGYGKNITIQHDATFTTRYAQLSEILVKEGDQVGQGQVIAKSGSSGASTAPHLHYEIHKNGEPVDPLDYMDVKEIPAPKAPKEPKKPKLDEEKVKQMAEYDEQREKARQAADRQREVAVGQKENAERQKEVAERQKEVAEQQRATAARQQDEARRQMELAQKKATYRDEVIEQKEKVEIVMDGEEEPIFIIDGEEYDREVVGELNPKKIAHIEVLKGEKAIEQYGDRGKNGVVIVTTITKEKAFKIKDKKKNKQKNKDKG